MAQFRNAFLFDNTVIMLLILYNNIPTVCVCIESERALLWGATIKSLSFYVGKRGEFLLYIYDMVACCFLIHIFLYNNKNPIVGWITTRLNSVDE